MEPGVTVETDEHRVQLPQQLVSILPLLLLPVWRQLQRSPLSVVCLPRGEETLTVAQLVMKFAAFYGMLRFMSYPCKINLSSISPFPPTYSKSFLQLGFPY
jgi:hypothetical protein